MALRASPWLSAVKVARYAMSNCELWPGFKLSAIQRSSPAIRVCPNMYQFAECRLKLRDLLMTCRGKGPNGSTAHTIEKCGQNVGKSAARLLWNWVQHVCQITRLRRQSRL